MKRKKCTLGKSCSAACINRSMLCIVELGPDLARLVNSIRGRWRLGGKRGARSNRKYAVRVEKLFKQWGKTSDPRVKANIEKRIKHLENQRIAKKHLSDRIEYLNRRYSSKDMMPGRDKDKMDRRRKNALNKDSLAKYYKDQLTRLRKGHIPRTP